MESFFSTIYIICGFFYTILAGKGKYSAFIFGIISSLLYSFLSFKNALWGSFLLNLFYYIPIEIISFVKWFKNTNPKTKSIYKTKLSLREFLCSCIAAVILSIILSYILFLNYDKFPLQDGFVTVFSIFAAYLCARRAIEQWIIWSIVNILTIIIWFKLANYTIILLWFTYLILGIIFYFQWRKEINSNPQ